MDQQLDRLFLQGKLSEDEYCALALNEGQVVAVAVDEVDRITTVSLSITQNGYLGEVLYSPEVAKPDEKFISAETSFSQARALFLNRIKVLERCGHSFEVTWFLKK